MLADTIIEATKDFNPTLLGRCDNGGADIHYPLETNVKALARTCGLKESSFHSTIWGYFLRVPGIVNQGESMSIPANKLELGMFLIVAGLPVSRVASIFVDEHGYVVHMRAGHTRVFGLHDTVEVLRK